jgi:hypothetical protein
MNKSESIKNLALALNKAQAEMGGAKKGKDNPFFKSKYADLSEVVQAVKEPFANNGLSYVQFPIEQGGRIGVETILMHESGEYLSNEFTVNLSKQDAQGAGSAITYCRRYALQAIAGIPSEDDDGNAASQPQKQDDNKPWYNDANFEADKEAMFNACTQGMSPQAVITQLRKEYKVSREMADSIVTILNGELNNA